MFQIKLTGYSHRTPCKQTICPFTYPWHPERDFQQCGILTSVDSDEPEQPLFKLRTLNDVQ